MKKKLNRLSFILIFLSIFQFQLIAQKSLSLKVNENSWNTAYQLFESNNFGSSAAAFKQYLKTTDSSYSILNMKAEFYIAYCSIELSRPNAQSEMQAFVAKYPLSNLVDMAHLKLGDLKYRSKEYSEALAWFNAIDEYGLNNNQRDDLEFKKAYSYFKIKDLSKAKGLFYKASQKETIYAAPSRYYYGHIAYTEGQLETALKVLKGLENNKVFAPIIPYYCTNIYFSQKKYEKVLSYSPPFIERASVKRSAEISKLVGLSYYYTKEYKKAISFLLKSDKKGKGLSREDMYCLAFSYYKIKDFKKAIPFLKKIGGKDALTQKASYCLADCCINTGDKKSAKAAFASTAGMSFDKVLQEESLLNYAKINYELAYSPFNEIIRAFEVYLEKYPQSTRKDEVYDYLVKVYMSSKNYEQALMSMDKVKNKNNKLFEAYQRAAYFRGVELFTQLNFTQAKEMFLLSKEYKNYNPRLAVENQYWLAESEYRLDKFNNAIDAYNEFLNMPGALVSDLHLNTYYNLAYAHFHMENYTLSSQYFNKFISKHSSKDKLLFDSYNRLGDCYFADRDYNMAISNYSKSSISGNWDADYAMYQNALCWGLLDKNKKKIILLHSFSAKYPNSVFVDDSYFEIAQSQILLEKDDDAIRTYKKLIKEYPKSDLAVKSYLQLGILNYSKGDYTKALNYYKQVVASNVSVNNNKSAMIGIKNIYVDMNKVDEYFSYAKLIGNGDLIQVSEKDSLTYISAERLFMAKRNKESINAFDKYLEQFPKGQFRINALYYRSDLYIDSGSYDKAILDLQEVLAHANNMFTRKALVSVSQITYKMKKYTQALATYVRLEEFLKQSNAADVSMPVIGQMRCNYFLNNYRDVVYLTSKIIDENKAAMEILREARYYRAKSYLKTEQFNLSLDDFTILSHEVQSFEGAESSYMVSKLLFSLDRFKDSEIQINKFIDQGSPHQYWLAKCFLLQSDIYRQLHDLFQAKYTLQSIIDNYTVLDDDIIKNSKQKLDEILLLEKEIEIKKSKEKIELEFNEKSDVKKNTYSDEKKSNY